MYSLSYIYFSIVNSLNTLIDGLTVINYISPNQTLIDLFDNQLFSIGNVNILNSELNLLFNITNNKLINI